MTRKAKAKTPKAGGVQVEDDGGAWMNDREGPKMAAFLRRFTSEPKAQAPLKNIIILSSPETGGLEKNTLRMVSKQFKDDAEEGTTSIKWKGPGKKEEEDVGHELGENKLSPVSLLAILAIRGRDGRFKDRLPSLKSIDCSGLDTLMNLDGCPSGLEVLNFYDCTLIKSLAPIAVCTNLRELNLGSTKVSSLKPLMGCVQLKALTLFDTPASDIRPLLVLLNLEILWMSDTLVSDLSPLSALYQLRALDLDRTPVTDLSPLGPLFHLKTLLCSETKISHLTPLSMCLELVALSIYGTVVESLNPLLQCEKLTYLNHGDLKGKTKEQTEGYMSLFKELGIDCRMECSYNWYNWYDHLSPGLLLFLSWLRCHVN